MITEFFGLVPDLFVPWSPFVRPIGRRPLPARAKKVLRGILGKRGLTDREAGKLAVAKHTSPCALLSP